MQDRDDQVRLRLGWEPIVLPEPLASLVLELVATRRGHTALGDQGTSRWLFPGGQPGRPVSAERWASGSASSSSTPGSPDRPRCSSSPPTCPPPPWPACSGIHTAVAVAWQRACSGDWAAYAAGVSRRTNPQDQ